MGNNCRVCLGRWRANLHVRNTAGTALSPAAFDAHLNSRTSPLDHVRASATWGLSQACAAGLVHGKSSEIAGVSTSPSLSKVLGAGISSPPFNPLDPCPHLPMVSQATAPVEIGGERLCCLGSGATCMLTHVSHRDGTDPRRSLHLPTEAEASRLADLNGTRIGLLWLHHHARIYGTL